MGAPSAGATGEANDNKQTAQQVEGNLAGCRLQMRRL